MDFISDYFVYLLANKAQTPDGALNQYEYSLFK